VHLTHDQHINAANTDRAVSVDCTQVHRSQPIRIGLAPSCCVLTMLPSAFSLPLLLVLLVLSPYLLVSVLGQNSSGGNLTFVRLIDPTPFPVTSSAGSAFLTTTNVTAGNGQSFPPASWIVLGHNYYSACDSCTRIYSNGQRTIAEAAAARPLQRHLLAAHDDLLPFAFCCAGLRRVDQQ
jgi:hypothetical protein